MPIKMRLSQNTRRHEVLRSGAIEVDTWRGLNPAVAALIESLPKREPQRIFVARDPLAPLTLAAAALWPGREVWRHDFDAFEAGVAAENLANHAEEIDLRAVHSQITADFPLDERFDLAVLTLRAKGNALLGRECLEMAHDLLVPGGRLLAATDGSPRWLQDTAKGVFGKVEINTFDRAMVVLCKRTRETARHKPRKHPLSLDFRGRDLQLFSRPGVFSASRIDAGSKALLDTLELSPGERVLDLGCGVGTLGLAAATVAGAKNVVMVDSDARAVALAKENAAANDLGEVQTLLRADLEDLPPQPFDLVVANPPYFSRGRIAESFTRVAAQSLQMKGRLVLVAKDVPRHEEILEEYFGHVEVHEVRGYGIHIATQPRPAR